MQDFGASNLPNGAGDFKSIMEADEEDDFEVEGELKQLSATTINHHASSIILDV